MRIDILTALPDQLRDALDVSVLRRAAGQIEVRVHDLRTYAAGKHQVIDDYAYGGAAGMVLKPEPIFACIEALQVSASVDEVIFLSPDGDRYTQAVANELSLKRRLVLLAGHYKGVDQRVRDVLVTREISIGDYVLSGGELPALVLVDSIVRLVPGVLRDASSALTDSFQDGLLGEPVYTRPASFRGMEVPSVLRSGDHDRIARWRERARLTKTNNRRPDIRAAMKPQQEEVRHVD